MSKVYVILQFDTEDFITPEADDILLELTNMLKERSVKASFCIVGEKARVLEKRGRRDVIDALKGHDIAYQSDFHSVHPVASEYLADEDWDGGVEKAVKQEASGLNDLMRIFGKKPSAFIQPGGSWAPQIPYAIMKLGVPVYADGIFENEPFWFCGILCLKACMHFPEHSTLEDLASLEEKFDRLYAEKQEKGGLIVIFSHPCMFVTETFWDSVNFSEGTNPSHRRYVAPPLRAKETCKESLRVFEEFLEYVAGFLNVKIVTFREIPDLYSEPKERLLSLDQTFGLAKEVISQNDWQIINGVSFSPAEILNLFVELILRYLSRSVEPKFVPVRFNLGPTSKPHVTDARRTLDLKNLLSLCYQAMKFMEEYGRIPSVLSGGNVAYGPGDLLEAAAKAIVFYSKCRRLPENVEIGEISDVPQVVGRWNLTSRVRSQWNWIVFRRGFTSHRIEDLTIGQSWTIRPAAFSRTWRKC